MPRGIGVFRAKGRPKGVHLAQGQTVALHVQLAGHGEVGFLSKKIVRKINRARLRAREVFQIQRAHAKHLARPLTIAAGHDRRMNPVKSVLVKVAVNSVGQAMSHARHRREGIGAHAQVRLLAEVLERVPLGRHGVGLRIIHHPHRFDALGQQFNTLSLALGRHHLALGDHRATGGEMLHFAGVIIQLTRGHHLRRLKTRAIVQLHK